MPKFAFSLLAVIDIGFVLFRRGSLAEGFPELGRRSGSFRMTIDLSREQESRGIPLEPLASRQGITFSSACARGHGHVP